jgi:hypothetical protein
MLVLTEKEMQYLKSVVGSDVTGRHADWSPYKKEAQKVWEKVK